MNSGCKHGHVGACTTCQSEATLASLREKNERLEAEVARLTAALAEAYDDLGLYTRNDHPISNDTLLKQSRDMLDLCEMIRGGETTQQELVRLRQEVEDVRALDALAKQLESTPITPGYVGVTSKVDGSRLGYWRISVNGIRALQGDCQGMFPSAPAARRAVVECLEKERKDG